MGSAALVMAGVSATAAIGGVAVLAWPTRGAAGAYGKRIAGTMLCALALILALFALGLARASA